MDLQHNVLASEKRNHEIAFQMVFKSLVKKELKVSLIYKLLIYININVHIIIII